MAKHGLNCWKGLDMAGNDWKWLEWLKTADNGWKWLEITEKWWNGWILLEMVGHGPNC